MRVQYSQKDNFFVKVQLFTVLHMYKTGEGRGDTSSQVPRLVQVSTDRGPDLSLYLTAPVPIWSQKSHAVPDLFSINKECSLPREAPEWIYSRLIKKLF